MAVTKEVAMVSIADAGDAFAGCLLYGTAKLILKRDAVEILNRDFTAKYKVVPGQSVDDALALWAKNTREQMQDAISDYVRERALLMNAKLATAVTGIQTALNIAGV
jgi:hypothetical protein